MFATANLYLVIDEITDKILPESAAVYRKSMQHFLSVILRQPRYRQLIFFAAAAFTEELLFRWGIQGLLTKIVFRKWHHRPENVFSIISAGVWAFPHLWNFERKSLPVFLFYLWAGMLFSRTYLRLGLPGSTATHALVNIALFLSLESETPKGSTKN